jgi:hypothetical protein
MSGTYTERSLGKLAGSHILPGSGDAASSIAARMKVYSLEEVLQQYFQDTGTYTGGDIPENDPKKAIQYVISKKLTKSNRKGVIAAVKFSGFVAGAATGATVGSVVPVAGTMAGGAVGGVALGTMVSGGTTLADHIKRKSKALYKIIRGTRGEHRKQAARCLLIGYKTLPHDDIKYQASCAALLIILGEEFNYVAKQMPEEAALERLADRLKSN